MLDPRANQLWQNLVPQCSKIWFRIDRIIDYTSMRGCLWYGYSHRIDVFLSKLQDPYSFIICNLTLDRNNAVKQRNGTDFSHFYCFRRKIDPFNALCASHLESSNGLEYVSGSLIRTQIRHFILDKVWRNRLRFGLVTQKIICL